MTTINPTISQEEVRALHVRGGSLTRAENKYGVAPKHERVYAGQVYDSKREAAVAAQLDVQYRMGLITKIERQVPYEMKAVGGITVCKYYADFRVTYRDGRQVTVEVKGKETREWRIKYKWFKIQYPDIVLEVVK